MAAAVVGDPTGRWGVCAAAAAATTAAAVYFACETRRLRAELAATEQLWRAERKGRATAERKLVATTSEPASAPPTGHLPVAPIGTVSSPYHDRNGTPRQPGLVRSSVCTIRLHPTVNHVMLQGLADYSHIYVVWWFHQNTNVGKGFASVKGVVSPPMAGGEKVGVFACRTPHRPNPIGLSLVPIAGVDVKRGVVKVVGLDVIDGTPVLDIKPYLPRVEAVPEATCPSWVDAAYDGTAASPLDVVFTSAADDAIAHFDGLRDAWTDLRHFIAETLRIDFRSARQRPLRRFEGNLRLQRLQVEYTIDADAGRVTVTDVRMRRAV